MNHKISIKTKDSLLSLDEFKARDWNCGDIVGVVLQTKTIGVIISLDEWGTALCKEAECKIFNRACNESEALQTLNGLEFTRAIAMQSGSKAAATKCWHYNVGGLQWYLPCIYELSTIAAYRKEINEILETIGATQLSKDKSYWSSSESSRLSAWYVNFDNNIIASHYKYNNYCVRAVAAFEPLVGSHDKPVNRRENKEPSYELTEEIAIEYLRDHGYTGKITKEINIK